MPRPKNFCQWTIALALALALPAGSLVAAPTLGLLEAAKNGDAAAVRSLLEQGLVDVNAPAPDGATALHWVAHLNDFETAKLLVGAGASVDTANRYGVTPLMSAATNGNIAMIKLLLEAGADPNAALPEGETVLMTAARTGRAEAVKALLDRGAAVNAQESWRQQTALMWAAAEGHLDTVDTLIQAGAEVGLRSKAGFTAFLFAARQGHRGVISALLDAGANVNQSLPARPSRRRRNPPPAHLRGPSALVLAVTNAHYELAAVLLDKGADPNAAQEGWTALHTITWVRKPGMGSNDPAPPGSGNMDSIELVRKLVADGADVNARMTWRTRAGQSSLNSVGATPFLMAARTADAELMRLLAELGADPLLPNENNTTPLMVAAGVGARSPGEDAGTESEALEAVQLALELGNDVNAVDDRGETAMHGAAYKYLPSVARYLAGNGAKVELWNRNNKNGWTPLRIAAGVHRGMNLRSSAPTAAVLREVMTAAGVSTEVEPETNISGATR